MQRFEHIVVDFKFGRWQAWFNHDPHVTCLGDDWACAVAILIDRHGSPDLQWDQILPIEDMTWDGHAEFLVPEVQTYDFPPLTSVN